MTDDDSGKALGGAVLGAAIGSAGGPAGAVLGGVLGGLLGAGQENDYDHDELVQDTYETVNRAVPSDASVYTDHISPSGAEGNPQGELDNVGHIPDLLIKGFATTNTIVEVETPTAIGNDPDHIVSQLDDFRVRGYKRVLVVPEAALDDAEVFVEKAVEGPIEVLTPSMTSQLF